MKVSRSSLRELSEVVRWCGDMLPGRVWRGIVILFKLILVIIRSYQQVKSVSSFCLQPSVYFLCDVIWNYDNLMPNIDYVIYNFGCKL